MQQFNASLVYGRKLNQNQLFFDRTTIKQSVPMQQSHRQCSTPLYQEQPSQMVEIATLKPPKQQPMTVALAAKYYRQTLQTEPMQ